MITLDSIFDDLHGPAELARVIGVSTEHATAMKRRRSIPVRYWPALLTGLRAAGVIVNEADLVRIYNEPNGTPAPTESSAA